VKRSARANSGDAEGGGPGGYGGGSGGGDDDDSYAPAPKAKRRKKDPGAPKKAKSGYIVFLERHRGDVTGESPGISMSAVTSELAKRWRLVTDEERAACDVIADVDKARYQAQMRLYVPPPKHRPSPSFVAAGFAAIAAAAAPSVGMGAVGAMGPLGPLGAMGAMGVMGAMGGGFMGGPPGIRGIMGPPGIPGVDAAGRGASAARKTKDKVGRTVTGGLVAREII
jgi:hypothetical protein